MYSPPVRESSHIFEGRPVFAEESFRPSEPASLRPNGFTSAWKDQAFTPRMHRTDLLHLPDTPGKAISLDDYVESARRDISSRDVRRILDSVVEIGLIDDARVVARVLALNPSISL